MICPPASSGLVAQHRLPRRRRPLRRVDRLAVVVRVEHDRLRRAGRRAARHTRPAARRSATRAAAPRSRGPSSCASRCSAFRRMLAVSLARFGMARKSAELAHDLDVVALRYVVQLGAKRVGVVDCARACGRRQASERDERARAAQRVTVSRHRDRSSLRVRRARAGIRTVTESSAARPHAMLPTFTRIESLCPSTRLECPRSPRWNRAPSRIRRRKVRLLHRAKRSPARLRRDRHRRRTDGVHRGVSGPGRRRERHADRHLRPDARQRPRPRVRQRDGDEGVHRHPDVVRHRVPLRGRRHRAPALDVPGVQRRARQDAGQDRVRPQGVVGPREGDQPTSSARTTRSGGSRTRSAGTRRRRRTSRGCSWAGSSTRRWRT